MFLVLWLGDLLLPEELEVAEGDDQLESQTDPEPLLRRAGHGALAKVGEGRRRDERVRAGCARKHRHRRTNRLRADEHGEDVLPCQGGEQHHTQTDTLDGVQETQPEP